MKQYINTLAAASLLALSACTGNFEDYNTDHYQIYEADAPILLKPMIETVVNIQQNNSQMQDQMVGTLGGYFTLSNRWDGTNFDTFNQSDGWNAIPWNDSFTNTYGNFFKVEEATGGTGHYFALARFVRAITMLRVVDCYGPIPYSKVKQGDFYVAYDDAETVYTQILDDCANAATVLSDYNNVTSGNRPMAGNDPIYNGDYAKWARLANSMRLRVAIRIGKAFPTLARTHAEGAIAHPAGLIQTNEDNAMLDCGTQPNPYWLASSSWGDLRVNASIVDYMKGYNDPRLSKYFTKCTFAEQKDDYIGMRSGTAGFQKATVAAYSQPAFVSATKLMVFCAAETAFLRAEGFLNGWNMGSGDAATCYNDGILLSMQQHGVSGLEYVADRTSTPGSHVDPRGSSLNYTPKTTITIAWDEAAPASVKLERIITQKWIANYPLGIEAWAEYRRTGYPELFPCIDNLSRTVSNNVRGMRRLRYPHTESQNNTANYQQGVALLGGADNENTDLVWGKTN